MLFRATHFYYSCAMIDLECLRRRASIVNAIRRFFDSRGYLSVETPILARTPIPESHIQLLRTRIRDHQGKAVADLALLPSPEYYLKRLLAAGSGSLYEITRSFRNGEPPSGIHSAEFTMLEYYTVDADGDDSIPITLELLKTLGIDREPLVLTMDEAWRRWAGFALEDVVPPDSGNQATVRAVTAALTRRARESGTIGAVHPEETGGEDWPDLFYRIFVNAVEPELPRDRPVIITRYPDAIPTLARRIPGTVWADRWELYLGGMEIANCYGEETHRERLRSFFTAERDRIAKHDGAAPEIDRSFPDLHLPRCSGVALGVDRLVAAIIGDATIDRVISFFEFR